MTFFLFLYSPLYRLGLLLAWLLRGLNPKLAAGFRLRSLRGGLPPWLLSPAGQRPIWFHCSSGELEYAKPVIRLCKQNFPHIPVLVTFFSPSVAGALANLPEVDYFCPSPWDTGKDWNNFLRHHQPRALLVARTDLWPLMLSTTQKEQIPRLLFSRVANHAKSRLSKWLENKLLRQFNDVFCVSEADRAELASRLGPHVGVHAAGDTRYDQCLYRLQHPRPLKPLKNFSRPTLIGGSTWPADEEVLIPTMAKMMGSLSFVLAPHEPHRKHLDQIIKRLSDHKLSWTLYSEAQDWNPKHVLIIDQVGILADLYAWGQFAFIGNSMKGAVHSVMEPLAQGLLTFVGPRHTNSREALDFQKILSSRQPAVQVIHTSQELEAKIQQALMSWTEVNCQELKAQVRGRLGASQRVLLWLEKQSALTSRP